MDALSGKQKESPVLESIRNDLRLVGTYMRDLSFQVMREGISDYPLYIASQHQAPMGKPFLSREQHHLNWNYNASILEEFIRKEVVLQDKVEEFKETFGDPDERACIFVITPVEGGFIFVPYTNQEDENNQILPEFN